MTDKRPSSAKARRECFEAHKQRDETGRLYLVCHICGGRLDPAREAWEAEHVLPHAFGGKDLRPAHYKCHKHKTATVDVPAIAKSKRQTDKHFGIKRRGWNTKWKRKPLATEAADEIERLRKERSELREALEALVNGCVRYDENPESAVARAAYDAGLGVARAALSKAQGGENE